MTKQKWYKVEDGPANGAVFDLNSVELYTYEFTKELFYVKAYLSGGSNLYIYQAVDFIAVKKFMAEILKG